MLKLVEDRAGKIAAQQSFTKFLQTAWRLREQRRVVWRPSARNLDIAHDREFWFSPVRPHGDQKQPRYWNSFGTYQPEGNLQIAVEINIPTETNAWTISGFIARDEQSGMQYLMHDGGVGGGRPGIGRDAFLAWSGAQLVQVENREQRVRQGIIVTPIRQKDIGEHVARFVRLVSAFKQAAVNGELASPQATEAQRTYAAYFKEFSGRKKGRRKQEFDYISRHGDIVDALSKWRGGVAGNSVSVVKNAYIDLGIASSKNELIELYEVKTNTDRQSLYTAIGQLIVHGASGAKDIKRFLVVPHDGSLPQDVTRSLKSLGIKVLRYQIQDHAVLLEPSHFSHKL